MLENMRKDFKKYRWTLYLVIIFFAGGFILTDLFSPGSIGKSNVAMINDTKIKAVDFQRELQLSLDRYNQDMKRELSRQMIQRLNLPFRTLQTLIQSTVIQMEADKYDIKVSENEIQNTVRKLFSDKNGFVGVQRYKDFIRVTYHMTTAEYEKELEKTLRLEKLKALLTSGTVINHQDLLESYQSEKDKIKVEYIMLTTDNIKDKIPVTDQEIGDYYQKNKDSLKSAEKRKGTLLLLDNEFFKSRVKISELEIYEYYKKNKEQFMTPGKTKVSRIFLKYDKNNRSEILKKAEALQKTLTSENFAQKAKELSEDEKAKDGGDYGYLDWKNLSNQENVTIDRLNEKNISIPVDTQAGFAILYIAEKVTAKQKVLNEVKEVITDTLQKERLSTLVDQEADKIYNQVKGEKDLKAAAQKSGFKTVETSFLSSGETIKDIDLTGTLSGSLFRLTKGVISKPVKYFKGVAILQLTDILPPQVQPLSEVKQRIIENIQDEKKKNLLESRSSDYFKELAKFKDDKKLKEYCEKKKLNLQNTDYQRGNRFLRSYSYKGLDNLILTLPENKWTNPLKMNDNFVILRVVDKTLASEEDFKQAKHEYYQTQINKLKNDYFAAYILEKQKKCEIRFNQDLYTKIVDQVLARFK